MLTPAAANARDIVAMNPTAASDECTLQVSSRQGYVSEVKSEEVLLAVESGRISVTIGVVDDDGAAVHGSRNHKTMSLSGIGKLDPGLVNVDEGRVAKMYVSGSRTTESVERRAGREVSPSPAPTPSSGLGCSEPVSCGIPADEDIV